jgi:hypothetical protein
MWNYFFCNCNSICNYGVTKIFNPYVLSSKSHLTNYIKRYFFLYFHIKIHVPFVDELIKVWTLKKKTHNKILKIMQLLFDSPTFLPSYLLSYLSK